MNADQLVNNCYKTPPDSCRLMNHIMSKQQQLMEEKEMSEVVLLGLWGSSRCTRISQALKLKGIPYKYVEEDLTNKSELLLKSNPVHKKVPVLLHNGMAISESLIILEYIDETWNHTPKLLPDDPYQKAKVRFWVNYYDQKVRGTFLPFIHGNQFIT